MLSKFYTISDSDQFIQMRISYWGFLLVFSGIIYQPGQELAKLIIFLPFLGMLFTMTSFLLKQIGVNLTIKKFFTCLGLTIDTVFLSLLTLWFLT